MAAAPVFPAGNTLAKRFPPPAGYERSPVTPASFSAYLQQLPLQPHGSKVHYFDGRLKPNTSAYCAVIRMEIGNRDLQQCADAVMRLRGEYLFSTRQWDQLGFAFGDGRMHYFSETCTDRSYTCFRKWMDQVFAFAGTRSLYGQLKPKPIKDIRPGDVLIQTGNPYGHAVIVLDVVYHWKSGEKLFMLAQSFMPAQEIQVLNNPGNPALSPWYRLRDINREIQTPEWLFTTDDLRSF